MYVFYIYLKVQWDEGRLLVIGGREFSYSGTHFNGDVTDVQVQNILEKLDFKEKDLTTERHHHLDF